MITVEDLERQIQLLDSKINTLSSNYMALGDIHRQAILGLEELTLNCLPVHRLIKIGIFGTSILRGARVDFGGNFLDRWRGEDPYRSMHRM